MASNEHFHLGLWIGGGISWYTLERLEVVIGYEVAKMKDCPMKMELQNLQNACWAQLSKRPRPVAAFAEECDLV